MEKSEILKDVNQKNTMAVEQALKEMTKRIEDQEIHINGLNNTMSNFNERMNVLETFILLQKVKSTGSGPSVVE